MKAVTVLCWFPVAIFSHVEHQSNHVNLHVIFWPLLIGLPLALAPRDFCYCLLTNQIA